MGHTLLQINKGVEVILNQITLSIFIKVFRDSFKNILHFLECHIGMIFRNKCTGIKLLAFHVNFPNILRDLPLIHLRNGSLQ